MRARVIVVGSVNADLVMRVPRLPVPGETVTGGVLSRSGGGKGANQAIAAARLGARVSLVARVGADELGEQARRELEAEGVDVEHVSTSSGATGVAHILVAGDGENMIAVAAGANDELSSQEVERAVTRLAAPGAVVLAGLEVPDAAVAAAAAASGAAGCPFVLNPAPARRLSRVLVSATALITPNEVELAALGGAAALLEAGARALMVTRGAHGAELHRPGGRVLSEVPPPVDVVDATGAGDAFSAAVAVALGEGRSPESALRWGVAAGALATRAIGARGALPGRAEVVQLAEG